MRPDPIVLLRRMLTDEDAALSLARRARRRRWAVFAATFPRLREMRVVDLGGTPSSWLSSGLQPAELVLLNVVEQESPLPWMTVVHGDACRLPRELASESFDLVYSNSVIDQVGGHARREEFAASAHSLAPRHWIQTAYRYFPLDPYWLFPGFASLPLGARVALTRTWRLSQQWRPDRDEALRLVLGVELMTELELRYYFPHAEVLRERVAGLTKSLVAVR